MAASVDLLWLPLGAGGRSVRVNGRVFEAVAARLARRDALDLYHSALEVHVEDGRYAIEMAPVWNTRAAERGVVAEGAVGARAAGRLRLFRYEVRRWRDGTIPDAGEAVESPRRLTDDGECARQLLELVPQVPTPVWGRDELRAGEMWNSNSLTSWLLVRAGLDGSSDSALDIFRYRHILSRDMARAATTLDAFNAVAEPRRRQILDVLARGERPVNDLVEAVGLAQPQVSKHLRVLREVGAVAVREDGRRRLYRVNGEALKPIHDWVRSYEQLWSERFDLLDAVVHQLEREETNDGNDE